MQDLIQQLTEKAGLTTEQAEQSLMVIQDYIKSKIPPMMHGMIDNFLGAQPQPGGADEDFLEGNRPA
jgi:hypothetical protein